MVSGGASPIEQWVGVGLKNLNELRTLANSLADEARYMHVQGNDAESMECLADLAFLAWAQGKRPMLINHLVSVGIHALHAYATEAVATTLNGPGTRQPAATEAVHAAIAQLLGDQPRQIMKQGLMDERIYVLNADQPAQQRDKVAVLRALTDLIASIDEPPGGRRVDRAVDPAVRDAIAAHGHRLKVVDRLTFDRRVAAIGLAMALYRQDHGGQWPGTLEALVPKYLPAAPVDPYSPSGKPLRYERLAEGKRPMVRSVGPDGVAGPIDAAPEKGQYAWYPPPGESDDQWRDLSL